jgi:hypothetical protein
MILASSLQKREDTMIQNLNPQFMSSSIQDGKYLYANPKGELLITANKKELKRLEKEGYHTKVVEVAEVVKKSNLDNETKLQILESLKTRMNKAATKEPSTLFLKILMILMRLFSGKNFNEEIRKIEELKREVSPASTTTGSVALTTPLEKMLVECEELEDWADEEATKFYVEHSNELKKHLDAKNYREAVQVYLKYKEEILIKFDQFLKTAKQRFPDLPKQLSVKSPHLDTLLNKLADLEKKFIGKESPQEKNKIRLQIEEKLSAVRLEMRIYFSGIADWCDKKLG